LQIEVQLGDENTQGICLNNIGSLYVEEGNYGDALTYFQRSLDLQQKLKVPSDIARSLNNLGETYLKLGKFDSALDNYLKALEVARGAGDKSLVALSSDGMGRLFQLQGRNGAALSAEQDAIKNIQDLQQQTADSAQIQGDYGTALALIGRFDDAQKNLDAAVAVARSLKNDALVSAVLNLQGERLFYQGDLSAARSAFDQALQSASKQKSPAQAMQIKLNQARVDVYQNRGSGAVNNLKALIKNADAEGMNYFSLQCSLYLGRALFQSKNYPQSQQTLEMVFRRAQDQGMKSLLPEAHYWLAQTLRASGAKAEADIHMQQAQKLLQDLKNESHSDDILKRQDLKPIAQELGGKTS
jgi:tetratricopeptide (TPR) repeat protein